MSLAVTGLAALGTVFYVGACILVLRGTLRLHAGSRFWTLLAVAAFAAARIWPQSATLCAVSASLLLVAIWRILRRSTPASAALVAGIPAFAMLLVVIRPFFPPGVEPGLQNATIAVLCAAAPAGVISLLLERSAFRTKSAR